MTHKLPLVFIGGTTMDIFLYFLWINHFGNTELLGKRCDSFNFFQLHIDGYLHRYGGICWEMGRKWVTLSNISKKGVTFGSKVLFRIRIRTKNHIPNPNNWTTVLCFLDNYLKFTVLRGNFLPKIDWNLQWNHWNLHKMYWNVLFVCRRLTWVRWAYFESRTNLKKFG